VVGRVGDPELDAEPAGDLLLGEALVDVCHHRPHAERQDHHAGAQRELGHEAVAGAVTAVCAK